MAVTVREGLRRLCADGGGWSYAVLWRAADTGGLRHFVWGEGVCETPWISSISGGLQDGDLKLQTDDGFGAIMENIKSEVHVFGNGLIGSVALTGKHLWINRNALSEDGYNSTGFAWSNHLLFSGIQTIAILPVLPHGVVQLGSVNMIMEDTEFLNRVKCLVLQLESLPGEVVFHNAEKGCLQNNLIGIRQLIDDSAYNQIMKIPSSFSVAQPSSVSEIDENRILAQGLVPLSSNPGITVTSSSITEFQQQKPVPVIGSVASLVDHQKALFEGKDCVSSDLCTVVKSQFIPKGIKSECKSIPSGFGASTSGGSSFLNQASNLSGISSANDKPYLDSSFSSCLQKHGYNGDLYSQGLIMVQPICERGSHESTHDPGKMVLLPVNQQTRHVCNLDDLSKFARIPYLAKYSLNKDALMGKTPVDGIPSTNYYFENTNVLGGTMQDEMPQNSGTQSFDYLSTTCSKSISPPRCMIQGVNFDHDTKEWKDCSIEKRKTVSIPIEAEGSTDLFMDQKPGNDLFDVLGLYDKPVAFSGDSDFLFGDMCYSDAWNSCIDDSGCPPRMDTNRVFDSTACGTSSDAFLDSRHDQLLDAVISKVNFGPSQSEICSLYGNTLKHGQLTLPGQLQAELLGDSPSFVETGLACSSVKSSCSMAESGGYYSEDAYKTQINLWSENDQNIKSSKASLTQFNKADEIGKISRKRSKPGESPRPRPKDRQMIQDRVKELREIVPNGAKLSIDALLERTIKHMLFLQGVTKHADKLKEIGEPKIINKEGGLLLKDNFEGGATWAFEVGSQSMICPIIVEDLNPPRQLLVEMLCEERGFFLEIADLIKGLGLTILKGVMEARGDKVWARFAVEANRDVTRMDIFLSLVQLLEPKAATGVSQQGFDSTNVATNISCPYIPPAGASKPLE